MIRSHIRAATRSRFPFVVITCCAMICGTVLLAPMVQASRQDGGSAAAVVATIDLERVIDNLDAMGAANAELTAAAETFQARIEAKREALQLLDEEIDLLVGQQRDDKLAEAEVMADDLRLETQFAELKLEEMRVRSLRDIYENVRIVAGRLSQANGWDLVLVNDALVEVPAVATQQDLMRQISARRVIYSDVRIDVTDVLITAMNGAG
jgi:Skp family chaperone for outer membrane proteins